MKKCYSIIFAVMLLALTGCQETPTHQFLMQHPEVLQKAARRCETVGASDNEALFCEMVIAAASDFDTLLLEQQRNPEKFGQRILEAQMACATANQRCDEVEILLGIVGLETPK